MSDSYQAIYDAVRSRICGFDGSRLIDQIAGQFDVSMLVSRACGAIDGIAYDMQRPSVLYRPAISIDGNKWCALYGANLQDGVAGFGDSPAAAMDDFDKAWGTALRR